MKNRFALTISTLALSGFILSPAVAEDTDGWETEINAGLNLTDGNSETLMGNIGYDTKKVSGANETSLSADYSYGETDNETTTDAATAELQYKRAFEGAWYGYGAANYLYDDIAMVDYRVMLGPGLGYRLIEKDNVKMNVEFGVVWVTEDVAGVDDDYTAIRAAQTYERQLNDNAKVWQSVEYVPDVDDSENYIVNASIGIDSKISENMALRLEANNRFDNSPGVGLEDNDLQVIAGLVFKR